MTKEEAAGYLLKDQIHLTSFVSSITRDFQAAEDVFQDICVKAISLSETFSDYEHLRRWARMSCRNKAIDYLRKHKTNVVMLNEKLLDILQNEWPSYHDGNAAVSIDAIGECVKHLTDNNRRLVRLRYFEGLSGIEVAQAVQRKVETVYQALARIHKQLGDCVRKRMAVELNNNEK